MLVLGLLSSAGVVSEGPASEWPFDRTARIRGASLLRDIVQNNAHEQSLNPTAATDATRSSETELPARRDFTNRLRRNIPGWRCTSFGGQGNYITTDEVETDVASLQELLDSCGGKKVFSDTFEFHPTTGAVGCTAAHLLSSFTLPTGLVILPSA